MASLSSLKMKRMRPTLFSEFANKFQSLIQETGMSATELFLVFLSQNSTPVKVDKANAFFSRQEVKDWFDYQKGDMPCLPFLDGFSRTIEFWKHPLRSVDDIKNLHEMVNIFQNFQEQEDHFTNNDDKRVNVDDGIDLTNVHNYDALLGWRLTKLWNNDAVIQYDDYLNNLVSSERSKWRNVKPYDNENQGHSVEVGIAMKVVHAVGGLTCFRIIPHVTDAYSYFSDITFDLGQLVGLYKDIRIIARPFGVDAIDYGIVVEVERNKVTLAHDRVIPIYTNLKLNERDHWVCIDGAGNICFASKDSIPMGYVILGQIVRSSSVATEWTMKVSPHILTDAAFALLRMSGGEFSNRICIGNQIQCLLQQMRSLLVQKIHHGINQVPDYNLVFGRRFSNKSSFVNALRGSEASTETSTACAEFLSTVLQQHYIDSPGLFLIEDPTGSLNTAILLHIKKVIGNRRIKRVFLVGINVQVIAEADFLLGLLNQVFEGSTLPALTYIDTHSNDNSGQFTTALQRRNLTYIHHNFDERNISHKVAGEFVLMSKIAELP